MRPFLILVTIITCQMCMGAYTSAQTVGSEIPSSAAGAVAQEQSGKTDTEFAQRYPRYALRPGDSFDLNFPFSPEFNQTVIVEPDGYATFRGAGTVHVAGQTIPQISATVKSAYTGILNDPEVTVALKEFEKPYFIAGGEVGKPGKYELRSDLSLVEAINIAGGFTDASKHSQVLLFRHISADKVEAHVFDVKKMIRSHDLQEDPHLVAGDLVIVPQNSISKIRRYLPTSSLGLYGSPIVP
jgi:polysaccharide export outer membrane protein